MIERHQVVCFDESMVTLAQPVSRSAGAWAATLEGFVIPYGQAFGNGPFVEQFVRGAFADYVAARHSAPLRAGGTDIGRGVFRENAAGLWGTFTLRDSSDAREIVRIAKSGVLRLRARIENRRAIENRSRDSIALTHTGARVVDVSLVLAHDADVADDQPTRRSRNRFGR